MKRRLKLNASMTSARPVSETSRTVSSGVHSPLAPARNANAWPANADPNRSGSKRRASDERATLGPSSAVPSTAASSATARPAAPSKPRGALTSPVAATTSRVPLLVNAEGGSPLPCGHPMAPPQPPGPSRIARADREHIVQEAAGGIHGERPHHPYRRERTQQEQPAPCPDHTCQKGEDDHRHHRRPAVDARMAEHLRQRNGAEPQPQEQQAEGSLQRESEPAVHAIASSIPPDGFRWRIQRWTKVQKANSRPTTRIVPPWSWNNTNGVCLGSCPTPPRRHPARRAPQPQAKSGHSTDHRRRAGIERRHRRVDADQVLSQSDQARQNV